MYCTLRGIYYSILMSIKHKTIMKITGHNYVEVYNDKGKQILECEDCGNCSVGYYSVE